MLGCALNMTERAIPSEMFDWSFTASVRSIVTSECSKEGSHNSDNLSTIRDMGSSFLKNEKRCLGIHPAAQVVNEYATWSST
jgi:hypothetical protein